MTEEEKQKIKIHIPNPKHRHYIFRGQKDNEIALLVIRKHWIVTFFIWAKMILWISIPLIIYFVVLGYNTDLWSSSLARVFLVVILIIDIYVALWYFIEWLDNQLDLIVVTNQRIVDINQTRIFDRKVATTDLAQVQDVSGHKKGIIATILQYGHLRILTASAESNVFEMKFVSHAQIVTSAIIAVRDAYMKTLRHQGQNVAQPTPPSSDIPPPVQKV